MNRTIARVARVLCWIAATASIAWTVRAIMDRAADGTLTGAVCLPLAIGVGWLLVGAGIGTRYERFALWSAVALRSFSTSPRLSGADTAR